MNRFEKPSILRKIQKLSLPLLGFILLFIVFIKGIASVSETTIDKQKESLTTALNRSITQCYAVEGTYPPSLDYLKDHYGLMYDENLFYVDYNAIGSNIRPDVTVIRRSHR